MVVEKTFGRDDLTKNTSWLDRTPQLQRSRMMASWKIQKLERTQNPARAETNLGKSPHTQNTTAMAADAGEECAAAKHGGTIARDAGIAFRGVDTMHQ